jgi:hypothetical protein
MIEELKKTLKAKGHTTLELEQKNKPSTEDLNVSAQPEEALAAWREVALKALGACEGRKETLGIANESFAKNEKDIVQGAVYLLNKKDQIIEEQKEELKGGTAAKATVKVPEKKIRQRQRASDDRGILNQDPQG